MNFSNFVVNNKKWILIITAAMVALSIVGTVFLIVNNKINSNMLEYLPKETDSYKGIAFLKDNFGIEGDAFVVVEGAESDEELINSVAKIKKEIKGITQFVWYDDIVFIESMLTKLPSFSQKVDIKTDEIKSYLRQPIYTDGVITSYNYVLLVLFDYAPSTFEAFNVHKQIRAELGDNLGRSVAISGMTALSDTILTDTMKEVPYYIIFSVLTVALILLLCSESFVEPLVLILTLGVSILLNMGSNYFYPQISIISFAACSVLQLGITMDYAIFLLHAYKEDRLLFDPREAAKKALPRTFMGILDSCLTTIGGFVALYFMRFSIGADLAKILIKGVVLSLVTIVVLQPCLMIIFDKAMQKTKHKTLQPNFAAMTGKVIKARHIIIIVTILMIVPAFIGQKNVNFSYLKVYKPSPIQNSQEVLAQKLANQIILAVPLDTKAGTHKEFMSDLMEDEKISNILGAYTIFDMDVEEIKDLLAMPLVGQAAPMKLLFSKVGDSYYTMYLATIEGDTEDKEAFATYNYLNDKLNYYFEESYPFGILTGVGDMAKITIKDFLRVTIISAAIIFIVMSLLLKSMLKSAMMVLLIELAIWLNISINTMLGIPVNFMIYIIISSVQLGCTIDYAILLSTRFEQAKKRGLDTQTAIKQATKSAFPSIILSALIIIGACLSVYFVTSNLLVKEMAYLMARGGAISCLLVLFVLPCLLLCFQKRDICKKSEDTNVNEEV